VAIAVEQGFEPFRFDHAAAFVAAPQGAGGDAPQRPFDRRQLLLGLPQGIVALGVHGGQLDGSVGRVLPHPFVVEKFAFEH
jgi:hypothetical protein